MPGGEHHNATQATNRSLPTQVSLSNRSKMFATLSAKKKALQFKLSFLYSVIALNNVTTVKVPWVKLMMSVLGGSPSEHPLLSPSKMVLFYCFLSASCELWGCQDYGQRQDWQQPRAAHS